MSTDVACTSSMATLTTVDRNERIFSDVLLSIKPEFMRLIAEKKKNHEYRKYKLRATVQRLWFYETSPTCAVR